jgi:hypothetical protein
MFQQGLSQICAVVGVALLSLSFGVLRYYKEKVSKLVNNEFSRLLGTKEILKFSEKIKKKQVTFEMVTDFYEQFVKANQPNLMLRRSWRYLLVSGVLFISASIVGCFDFPLVDFLGYELLAMGFFVLINALYNLVKLESKL